MLGRKPTATKKDWSVLKIAMNGMRLKNVQQSAESLALSQELNSLSPAREVMEEDLQAAETELQKTFRIAVRAAVELQGDLQHVQKRELAAKLESQLWERTKWVENIIDRTTSLKEREAEHKGATAALQEKVLAANQHISAALAATDESAREAEEESRRMLDEATAVADAAADEVEALRKRLNQVEGRVSSGEELLQEKLAANAALEKGLKDAAALHAFALADAREKHAAEAKELREKLSAAQMAFDTKLKAVESEREKEAAELRANLVAAEGDAAERISEAASTEGELQNLREKLEVSLAESVDASELREKLTAARDERERAVLDLEVEARKVDELRRELGDSIAAASLADDGLKAQLAAARAELLEKEGQITRNAEAHENEVAELQHKLVQAQSDGEAKVAVVAATKAEVEKRLAAAAETATPSSWQVKRECWISKSSSRMPRLALVRLSQQLGESWLRLFLPQMNLREKQRRRAGECWMRPPRRRTLLLMRWRLSANGSIKSKAEFRVVRSRSERSWQRTQLSRRN